MKAWNVETLDALVSAANAPAVDFAALFPSVVTVAGSCDASAVEVLCRAGNELAALVKSIIDALFPGPHTVPVAMCGGVFRNSALVRESFHNELQRQCPQVVIDENIVDPVRGALELARSGPQAEPQIARS